MLASGIDYIDRVQAELRNNDKRDIVLLFIGINQIAQVESGTPLHAIQDLYSWHPAFASKAPPDIEWIKMMLDELVRKRLLKVERGRYNTVHRQFASNFIDHCYFKAEHDTAAILQPIFGDAGRIKEIVLLWSWMQNGTSREFIRKWYRSFEPTKWNTFISAACQHSLYIAALLADRIGMVSSGSYRPMQQGFKGMSSLIASDVINGEANSLFYLQKLFSALAQDCPQEIRAIMEQLDVSLIAELLRKTEPGLYEELSWLFNSIAQVYPE